LRRTLNGKVGINLNDAQRLKQYLAEEMVEEYLEGRMSRRQMLKTVGQILGVSFVSPALLEVLGCSNPQANVEESEITAQKSEEAPVPESQTDGVTIDPNDPDIEVDEVEVPGEEGTIGGYQAQPSGEGPFAAILLIHENRGLTEHIRDVARRFAKVGYTGLAVDLLSRVGGSAQFSDVAETTTAISKLDQDGVISDLRSSVGVVRAATLRARREDRQHRVVLGWRPSMAPGYQRTDSESGNSFLWNQPAIRGCS